MYLSAQQYRALFSPQHLIDFNVDHDPENIVQEITPSMYDEHQHKEKTVIPIIIKQRGKGGYPNRNAVRALKQTPQKFVRAHQIKSKGIEYLGFASQLSHGFRGDYAQYDFHISTLLYPHEQIKYLFLSEQHGGFLLSFFWHTGHSSSDILLTLNMSLNRSPFW
jgi:hypothetical protein